MFLQGRLARVIIVAACAAISFLVLSDSKGASDDDEVRKVWEDGTQKMDRREFSAAIIDFSKALELDPNCIQCFSSRSWAKLRLGDSEGAEADATEAIRLDSNRAFAYFERAIARTDRGNLHGALADINRAIELRPNDARADELYYLRGDIEVLLADLDSALRDFDRAVEIGGTAGGYLRRASVRAAKGDLDGALADCKVAIEKDGANYHAYSERAHIKAAGNDLEGSLSDFNQAARLETNSANVLSCRGLTKQRAGDLKGAIADFQLAVQLNPTNHDYGSINLWVAQSRIGEEKKANEQLSEYLAVRRKSKAPDWPLSIMHFLLGKITEKEMEEAARSAVPATEKKQKCECYYYLGMKRQIEGNKYEALAAFRKCVETRRITMCEFGAAQLEITALEKMK
jgi:tetratricopeptide (TPR) repeat protein